MNLTSLDRVKALLSLTTEAQDDLLASLIEGVSDAAQAYIGRPLGLHTVTSEHHTASGEVAHLRLRHWPVQSVTAVVEGSTTLAAADYQLETSSDPRVGPRMLARLASSSFRSYWEAGSVAVTYEAGFVQEALPSALQLALARQCAAAYRETVVGGDRLGKLSESPQTGSSASFVTDAWLPGVELALRQYQSFGAFA